MKSYRVFVREVHVQSYLVSGEETSSAADAIKIVEQGKGTFEENGGEFSHMLDSSGWTVEETDDPVPNG